MNRSSPLWIAARHEWRMLMTDRVALLAVLAIGVAIAYAGVDGLQRAGQWRTDVDEYRQLQSRHLGRFERRAQAILEQMESGAGGSIRIHRREFDWGPHVPDYPIAWVPPKATLPAAPLAAAAVGNTDIVSVVLSGARFDGDSSEVAPQPGNPLRATLGHIDLAFVVVVLVPLFIIALTFDLFAGERDRGVLPLLLAQPIAGSTLAASKVLARGSIAVGWPALLVVGILLPEAVSQPGAAVRLALWTAAIVAYGLLWVGLALGLNVQRRSAAVNAVMLGAIWLLLTVVGPAAINAMLQTLHPVPPRAEWIDVLRASELDTRLRREALTSEEQRAAIERLLTEHPDLEQDLSRYTGMAFMRALSIAGTTQHVRDLAPAIDAFERPKRAQERWLRWLRFLAPPVLVQGMLEDLAGAGSARYREFVRQARDFHRSVERWAWDRRVRQVRMTTREYASIPRFRFVEETAGTAARAAAVPLGVLWMIALSAVMWGLRAARRLAPQ